MLQSQSKKWKIVPANCLSIYLVCKQNKIQQISIKMCTDNMGVIQDGLQVMWH